MTDATFDFIHISPGLPDVLTVLFPGWSTVALAGNASGAVRSCSGKATMTRMQYSSGMWSLGIMTDFGEINVCGDKPPVFSKENQL